MSRKGLPVVRKKLQIISCSIKLRNCKFLEKCSKWKLNFQNWSQAFCLGVSEPTKRLAAHSTAYALRNRQVQHTFVKKMKENICVKEI